MFEHCFCIAICTGSIDISDSDYQEREKPPPDPLYGLRVHSWVLVLSGKREVPESFFIEPFTGFAHPVDSGSYLGIESVWNHQNYWVNMQDCSQGVTVSIVIIIIIQSGTPHLRPPLKSEWGGLKRGVVSREGFATFNTRGRLQ